MYIIALRTYKMFSLIYHKPEMFNVSLMFYLIQKYIMPFLFTVKKRQAIAEWEGTTDMVWKKTMLCYDSEKTGDHF